MLRASESINVTDLIVRKRRIPWVAGGTNPETGLCCGGLAWIVLRRAGFDVPRHALVAVRDGGAADVALTAFLAQTDACWELRGRTARAATELGDLIVSQGRDGQHCSVIVDARTGKAVTTSRSTGVQLLPAERISSVTAVYRWRGPIA